MGDQKSLKGIVIALICTLLLIGGYSVYQTMNCKSNCETTTTQSTTTQSAQTNASVTTKTAEERYNEYLTNLANSIKTKYTDEAEEIISFGNDWGSAVISKNLELIAKKYNTATNTTDTYKIADNVVLFSATGNGQGAYYSIYYVTKDGKLYQAKKTDSAINAYEIKELEYKNIIEIRTGSMAYYGEVPIFVDIDGNIIYNK